MGPEGDFGQAVRADLKRAVGAIGEESSAAAVMTELSGHLRGTLYPQKSSIQIARRLENCMQTSTPIDLCVVLALETAARELPIIDKAIRVFPPPLVVTTALLVDWPRVDKRKFATGLATLTGDLELVSEVVERRIEKVRRLWSNLGYQPQGLEVFHPEAIKFADDDKDLWWLIRYYRRQNSYVQSLGPGEIVSQAVQDLTSRRRMGGRLRALANLNPSGLTLGLTTELNPQLLRGYGRVFIANIDVKRPSG